MYTILVLDSCDFPETYLYESITSAKEHVERVCSGDPAYDPAALFVWLPGQPLEFQLEDGARIVILQHVPVRA